MALGRPPTEGVPYLTDPVMMLAVAVEADGLRTLVDEMLRAELVQVPPEAIGDEIAAAERRERALAEAGPGAVPFTMDHVITNRRAALALAVEYPIPYPWAWFSSEGAEAARQRLQDADAVRVALAMDLWPALRSRDLISSTLRRLDERGWVEWMQYWPYGSEMEALGVPCTGGWLACAEVSAPKDLANAAERLIEADSIHARELGTALLAALGGDGERGSRGMASSEREASAGHERIPVMAGFSSSWSEPDFEGRSDVVAALRLGRRMGEAMAERASRVGRSADEAPWREPVRRVADRHAALQIVECVPEFWELVLESSPIAWGAEREIWRSAALRSRYLGFQPALIRSWEALARRSGVGMDEGSWLISGSEGRWALGAIWDVRWKWRLEHGIPEAMAWSWIANSYVVVCPN